MESLPKVCLFYITLGLTILAHAEDWPTPPDYVAQCVLIVEARQIGLFDLEKNPRLSFEVVECWKGEFKPELFEYLTKENYIVAEQGEHGVNIVRPHQRIIFFFTLHNQPEGKLRSHSTAFPVNNGKIVYAASANPASTAIFSVDEFKQRIIKLGTKK